MQKTLEISPAASSLLKPSLHFRISATIFARAIRFCLRAISLGRSIQQTQRTVSVYSASIAPLRNAFSAMNKRLHEKRLQIILLVLVTGGLAVAIWIYLIKPQQTALLDRKSVMAAAVQVRELAGRQSAFLEKSRAELAAAQDNLQELETTMAYGDVYRWAI